MMPPWGRTTPKGATAIAASNNVGKDFGSEHPIHTAAHTQPGNPRTTVVEGHSGQYRCPCFLAPRVDCHHAAHQSPLCVASLRCGGTHDLPTLQPCCLHCRSLVASSPMHAHAARLRSSPAGRHLPGAITPHAQHARGRQPNHQIRRALCRIRGPSGSATTEHRPHREPPVAGPPSTPAEASTTTHAQEARPPNQAGAVFRFVAPRAPQPRNATRTGEQP